MGVITPRRNGFAHDIVERIEDLILIVFLPLYFTSSGLKADITKLSRPIDWALVFLVLILACVGKIASITLATRSMKASWREAVTVGVLMNTRGLVGLIVLNVGLDIGILTTEVRHFHFCLN